MPGSSRQLYSGLRWKWTLKARSRFLFTVILFEDVPLMLLKTKNIIFDLGWRVQWQSHIQKSNQASLDYTMYYISYRSKASFCHIKLNLKSGSLILPILCSKKITVKNECQTTTSGGKGICGESSSLVKHVKAAVIGWHQQVACRYQPESLWSNFKAESKGRPLTNHFPIVEDF